MSIFIFASALLNGVAALVAGTAVYWRKKPELIHQTFAVFCAALAFWAFGSFWPIVENNAELSLLSFRVLHVGAFFLAIANFHFVTAILGFVDQEKFWIRAGYAVSILLLPLIGTQLFITGVTSNANFEFWLKPGFLYHIWIVIWLAYFIGAFRLLNIFYRKSSGLKKQQIKYIYLGEVVIFSALLMNFLPAYGFAVPIYFNIFIAGQVAAFAYTILRFRHLDLQLSIFGIVQKIFALIVSVGLGFGISYVVFFRKEELPVLALFPIISLTTYLGLSRFFSSQTFYHLIGIPHINDFSKAVNNFYERKLFYSNLAELKSSIRKIFIKKIKIDSAQIVLLKKNNQSLFAPLVEYFQKTKAEDLLFAEFFPEKEGDFDKLLAMGTLCLPLHGEQGRIVGFFFLGDKPRHSQYTQAELRILRAAATYISLSLKILNYSSDLRTEVEEKTEQLQGSYQRLQKADIEKDRFFSMTSHDLRTPLTIIKGYDDFLLSESFGKLNEKQKEFLSRIDSATGNMLELVNSILDFSKLEAGLMEFKLEPTDWQKIARETVEDFKIKCAEKSIQLKYICAKNLPSKIITDGEKLKRVFMNLLMNAFKFTDNKGRITMTVSLDPNPKFLRFVVADTGIGIAKRDFEMIFQEFRQSRNPKQKGGTGLGLPIVKKIVNQLGGKIWVESELEHGSQFTFTLPFESKK